jgi:hypothetical protein
MVLSPHNFHALVSLAVPDASLYVDGENFRIGSEATNRGVWIHNPEATVEKVLEVVAALQGN